MRIPSRPIARYPWYARLMLWGQRRKYGAPLASALLWARSPKLFFGVSVLYRALERRSSPLEPALRSLVQARISQLNDCAFCVDLNSMLAAERAGAADKALAVAQWRDSVLYAPRERLALEYAEAVTRSQVNDELAGRVKTEFGEETMIELTGLIAFQNMSAKFNAALDIPSQGFCQLPPGKSR